MDIKISNFKPDKNIFYTVKKNDTLNLIANKFNISTQYIIENNSQEIYEGLVLFLPEVNMKTYIVKPFDTLDTISQNNNCSVDKIKQKNNLSSDFLFVGQKLFL